MYVKTVNLSRNVYMLPPVSLQRNEELVSYIRTKPNKFKPPFRMISIAGSYMNSPYTKTESKDLFHVLLPLSTNARKTFLELHDSYNLDTGISIVYSTHKNQSEKNVFSLGFKELNKVGLVKKIKKEHYIINPKMYLFNKLLDQLIAIWDSLP